MIEDESDDDDDENDDDVNDEEDEDSVEEANTTRVNSVGRRMVDLRIRSRLPSSSTVMMGLGGGG